MKSLVFLGNKEIGFECLEHLIRNRSELGIELVACLSADRMLGAAGKSIVRLCDKNGIRMLSSLDELPDLGGVDLLISVQYHEILKKQHIAAAGQIAVNLHMAPLPEYRGCNQFTFAILDEAREFGTTIHRLEEGVDSGAILFEDRFPLPQNCFASALYRLTCDRSVALFKKSVPRIIGGDYKLTPQASLIARRGTSMHFRNEIESVKCINPGWDKEKQKKHFRATYFPPFPPPYYLENGKPVELTLEWYNQLG